MGGNRTEATPLTAHDIWALIDDRAGNTAQTLGVAEALGRGFRQVRVDYDRFARLPNALRGTSLIGVAAASRAELLAAPAAPDLVIGAGRRLAPVARWIKHRARRPVALCQIMDPGWPGRREFDLVAIPNHDGGAPGGGNVLRVTGAPHRVTAQRLAAERAAWADRLGTVPGPRIGVLVGGATKDKPFTPARAAALGRALGGLAGAIGGRVLLTTSRRTGREAEAALLAELPPQSWAYRWGDAGENPYFGLLAWADVVVVTGDSMSMASEACGTDKPVLIDAPAAETSAKHARLHAELYARRRALPLAAPAGFAALDCAPLNAADAIAAALTVRGL